MSPPHSPTARSPLRRPVSRSPSVSVRMPLLPSSPSSSSKLFPSGKPGKASSRLSTSGRRLRVCPSIIAVCLLFPITVTLMIYSLFPDSRPDVVDQMCPVKKWTYPTCLPRAGEILQHVPTPEEWVQYRSAYQRAVLKPENFSLEPSSWADGSATGFHVPVRVEYSKEHGRGVYAAAPIPKDTLVWDNRFTARLLSECEGRRFVQELTNDQACNVMMWGYSTDHGTGKLEWGIDLDPCTFLNGGVSPAKANVQDRLVDRAKALTPGGHSTWSTRDIAEGEELLSSYEGLRSADPRKNLLWQAKGLFMSWGWRPFLF